MSADSVIVPLSPPSLSLPPPPSPQIGWLPYRTTVGGYLWQAILVLIWTVCILITMVTQVLSCFKRDAVSSCDILISGHLDMHIVKKGWCMLRMSSCATPSPPSTVDGTSG